MPKIITVGDELDGLTVAALCQAAAEQLAAADADPRKHRIDLYRPVVVGGRTMFVRLKLTVPFVGSVDPSLTP